VSAASISISRRRDIYDVIWDAFTSMGLAIGIIVVLAVAAFVGTLLLQPAQTVDPNLLIDPERRGSFLAFARERYGFLAGPLAPPWLRDLTVQTLDGLGLFDIFNAAWFRVLLLVLACNVTMCTVQRLEPVWRTLREPVVRRAASHYERARRRVVEGPVQAAAVERTLRSSRYRVYREVDGDGTTHIHGDRNGWARFGTIATHLALLILMISGAIGTLFGFRADLAIPNGSSLPVFPVGTTNNITVRNEGFVATFRDDGSPSDFYSDLVLVQGGREVARQRVRVNDPLRYAGLKFHQSSFGPSADVEVRDATTGAVIISEAVRFFDAIEGVPADVRAIPNRPEQLFLALPPRETPFLAVQILQGDFFPLGIATVEPGQTIRVAGYEVTFRGADQYTVIRVARNTGENLLWLASGLFLVGLASTFYWPRRRVWARVDAQGTVITASAYRTVDVDAELDKLKAELSPSKE
jgi:cytochrome c biogenesis protein